jgi:hypothetical protein
VRRLVDDRFTADVLARLGAGQVFTADDGDER